jgi:hypothetical protein
MGKIRLKKEEDWDMSRLEQEIMHAANQIISFDTRFSTAGIDGIKLTIYVNPAMIYKVVDNY